MGFRVRVLAGRELVHATCQVICIAISKGSIVYQTNLMIGMGVHKGLV
jgi:hypothetical protein